MGLSTPNRQKTGLFDGLWLSGHRTTFIAHQLFDFSRAILIILTWMLRDFPNFAGDITHLVPWCRNRILTLFSVMILCGLDSSIATLPGTSKIIFSFLSF